MTGGARSAEARVTTKGNSEASMTLTKTRIPMTLLGCLAAVTACGRSSSTPTEFGTVAPASGQQALVNARPSVPLSGFLFKNRGTSPVTIDQIHVALASGRTVDGSAGLGLNAGASVTFLFDSSHVQSVASMSFRVEGSTEGIEVLGTTETGEVPQGRGGCTLSAASYDQSCSADSDCMPSTRATCASRSAVARTRPSTRAP
jgi:hypothetical protein